MGKITNIRTESGIITTDPIENKVLIKKYWEKLNANTYMKCINASKDTINNNTNTDPGKMGNSQSPSPAKDKMPQTLLYYQKIKK